MDNLFAPQLDLTVALSVCMFMFKKECLADLCYDTTEGTAYGATPGISFCLWMRIRIKSSTSSMKYLFFSGSYAYYFQYVHSSGI